MSKKIIQKTGNVVSVEIIQRKIYLMRGCKVMLDRDLAQLYGVETRRLNEQVKRNIKRFPDEFMFQLTKTETQNWISRFAISNKEKMGIRKMPYVFTQEGVAMLSSVLNSDRAIDVNIQIMKTFAKLREMLLSNKDLACKIEEMEKKYDGQFRVVFEAIRQLIKKEEEPSTDYKRTKIGFIVDS